MKIGIGLPNVVPGTPGQALIDWSRQAEAVGFDSLAVIDRLVYDSYESLITLAAAAAVTERIELVTDVLISPQHGTALLAKQAASIDRISGGRLTLGVGVGVREDDFAASGVPMIGRGARLDQQLTDLRRIWSGTGGVGPAPARPGGPPLLVGGDAAIAGPRAARSGDGWTMMVGTPDQFAAGAAIVHQAWQDAGRTDRPRLMAVFYAALGPYAADLASAAINNYYAWLGADLAGWIAGTAAVTEAAVADRLAPCSSGIDQLDRLAQVAVRRPAEV